MDELIPVRFRGRGAKKDGTLNLSRIKRQYVWAKSGGLCWYCGAQLYCREVADTELKKRLVFTVDHLHPRVHGGRGRANKVPACKYCNSHKSWRSVEQFREWVRVRLSGQAKSAVPRGWRINAEGVIFYFELARFGHSEVQDERAEEISDETLHHELFH